MLNIIYSIYNPKPHVIETHLNNWKSYGDLLEKVNIILIDDGSILPIDFEIDFPINLTIARIKEDIYWNVGGAQNLGHYLANDDWCFSTDIDHILTKESCNKLFDYNKESGNVYWFIRIKDNKVYKQHQNTFLIHKKDYNKIDGYDEDLSGNGGYNDALIIAKMQYYKLKFVNTDILVHLNENLSLNTKEYFKKGVPVNYQKFVSKVNEMQKGTYKQKSILNFNWKIVSTKRSTKI